MKKSPKLPPIDWGNPFDRLQKELTRPPADGEKYRLSLAIGACASHYGYLEAIWKRLEADYDDYGCYLSMMEKYRGKGENEDLTPISRSFFEEQIRKTTYLHLDYESFFIFSNILLNKVAYFVQLFFKNANLPNSFSKQQKFFQKTENIPFGLDEQYAKHVRESRWIQISLKGARDKLLEHGLTYVRGIKFSPKTQKITLPLLGWGRDLQKATSELMKLKSKYEKKYPQFKKIDNNIYEITKFLLDNPEISLDPVDQKTFFECLKKTGSELPDISSLGNNIVAFMKFFGSHFSTHKLPKNNVNSMNDKSA